VPKLYDYFGLIIMFYSNEHEPIHVHAKSQGRESRAEVIVVDGNVTRVEFADQPGRLPLSPAERRLFEELVSAKADDIVRKWVDYFVLNKQVKPETLTRRVK
jgi:hypothetical protein